MHINFRKLLGFGILFLLFLFISNTSVFAGIELTSDQISAASKNGLVDGLCFVYDLITGNVGKIIMCFFVVGIGWGFFLGEIKDYKTVFFFVLAIAIMYGGVEFAHIISGNNYSCDSFKKAQFEAENTIYNAGICQISEIQEYYPSQIWRISNKKDIQTFNEEITSETEIMKNNYVTLYTCQDGYLKQNKDLYIMYKCSGDGVFMSESNDNIIKYGSCKKACLLKDLKTIYNRYNFDSSTEKITNGYIDGNYYAEGTTVDVNCEDGYVEYDNEESVNESGVTIRCNDGGNFIVNGSCKPKCHLSKISYDKTTQSWNKCNNEDCSSKQVTIDTSFIFGDIIEVNTCKDKYSLTTEEKKLRLKCGNGGSWVVEQEGAQCSKSCNINDIYNYMNSNIGYCVNEVNCTEKIEDDKKIFYPNDEMIGVYGCKNNYEYSYGPTEPARYKCQTNGKWKNINDGYECNKKCDILTIVSARFTQNWEYYDVDKDEYIVLHNGVTSVKSGYKIRAYDCAVGNSVNPYSKTVFTCNNGLFSNISSKDDVCKPSCKLSALMNMSITNNVASLVLSNYSGKPIDNNKDGESDEIVAVGLINDDSYATVDNYYTIDTCKSGYNIYDGKKAPIFTCESGKGWKIVKNALNVCELDCKKADLPVNEGVIKWGYQNSDTNGELLEFSISSVKSGSIIKPKVCAGGYVLSNTNTSYYLCKNGEFVINNLNGALTVNNICSK